MLIYSGHTETSWTNISPLHALSRLAGVGICSPDHTHHHHRPTSNYSKRSMLFDKLFGTYEKPAYTEQWVPLSLRSFTRPWPQVDKSS